MIPRVVRKNQLTAHSGIRVVVERARSTSTTCRKSKRSKNKSSHRWPRYAEVCFVSKRTPPFVQVPFAINVANLFSHLYNVSKHCRAQLYNCPVSNIVVE